MFYFQKFVVKENVLKYLFKGALIPETLVSGTRWLEVETTV